MYVKEIKLSTSIHYVKSSDNLTTVRNELLKDKVSAQIVVNDANDIDGIITDKDLLKVAYSDFEKKMASDICSELSLTVTENDTIHYASKLMINNHCHHLLVTTEDKSKVTGIVSSIDIVNFYLQQHHS
jgi:signal-transduction protein with cAMP-binding, CBS, and nucleotidyltransferase domain